MSHFLTHRSLFQQLLACVLERIGILVAATEEHSVDLLVALELSAFGLADGRIYECPTFCTVGRGDWAVEMQQKN